MKKLAVFLFSLCLGQSVFSASVSYPPLIAVGETNTVTDTINEPLIAVSHDDGVTWAAQGLSQYPGAFPTVLSTSACGAGTGSTAVCVTGGMYVNASADSTLPLIASSVDAGDDWTGQTFSQYPGTFVDSSCTGAGSATTCVLIGYLQTSAAPLIAYTTNGAATWTFAQLGNEQAYLYSISCSGSGATAVCVAAGQDGINKRPLTAYSSNGGASWSFQDLSGIGSQQGALSASCAAQNPKVCLAVGNVGNGAKSQALVASSTDGGKTWQSQILPGADQALATASCTQSKATTACIADGSTGQPAQPLVVYGTYNGTSWTPWTQAVTTSASPNFYYGVSCAANANASVACVLTATDLPMVTTAVYANGTWTLGVPQVVALPQVSGLTGGMSCVNNVTSGVLCFVAGTQQITGSVSYGAPLVVTSSYDNSWSGWAAAQISNLPYPAGFFAGTGAGVSTTSGLMHRKNQ